MNCNIGGIERAFRILIGAVIVAVGIFFRSWWGTIGVLLLIFGLLGCRPLNRTKICCKNNSCTNQDKSKENHIGIQVIESGSSEDGLGSLGEGDSDGGE